MKIKNKRIYAILAFLCLVFTTICLITFINYDYAVIRIIRYLFLINILIILSYVDYKKNIIPNSLIFILLGARLIFLVIECILYKDLIKSILFSYFLGFIVGLMVFLLSSLIIKNSIGMGDVKLMGIIGFYVGIKDLFSCMLLSLILCLIVGSILILFKKMNSKDYIAFAPFLALGTIITLLFKL